MSPISNAVLGRPAPLGGRRPGPAPFPALIPDAAVGPTATSAKLGTARGILRRGAHWAHRRGPVALIKGGSGRVFGTCRLVDCLGPLAQNQMLENERRHRVPRAELLEKMPYPKTFAWVLAE